MRYVEFLRSFSNPHLHLILKNQVIELYYGTQTDKAIALTLFREAVVDNNLPVITFLLRECKMNPNDPVDQFGNKILFLVNDEVTAQVLVSNGAKISQKGILGQIPLHNAINASIAEILYQNDVVNIQDIIGDTPLHVASAEGRLDVVKFLLANGADINILNKKGQTALHKTSALNIAEALVTAGVDVNILDHKERTALHTPKNHKLTEYLLLKGTGINEQDSEGKTPLHYSVEKFSKHKISRLLLESDADIYIKDKNGQTALHKIKDSEIAKFLFNLYPELKGKIDDKDKTGHTPLQYAIDQGKKSLASLYIQAGADAKQTGDNGKTLLHLAHNVEMVDLLIKKGVDTNVTDEKGKTALYDMLYEGNSEAANILIAKMTSSNKEDESHREENEILSTEDKDNLLVNAVKNGYLSTVQLLMRQDADVLQKMEDGTNLSYFALMHGNIQIAKLLEKHGLALSQIEKDQLILESIATQNTDTLKYLIEIGSDIKQLNEQGRNFLYQAVSENKNKLVEFFLKETELRLSEEGKEELVLNAINNGVGQRLDLMIQQNIIDVNYIDTKSGSSILELAAIKGDKVLVDYLLSKDAKTDLLDKNKILNHSVIKKNNPIIKWIVDLGGVDLDKALENAVVNSNIRAAKLLLDFGANGAQLDANGNNLLTKVTNGPIGNILLKKYPELAQQQDLSGNSMIKNAILTNRINIVDTLIYAQDDNPAKTLSQEELDQLLIISIEKDHNKSVKWLIDNGAHVNQDTNNPLHVAAKSGNRGAAKLLFNKYADVAKKDQYGKLAVDYSKDNAISNLFAYHMMKIVIDDAYSQRNKEITLDVAIRYLKDPNLKLEDNSGHTLLTYVMYRVYIDNYDDRYLEYYNNVQNIIVSLINKGADINLRDANNYSPICHAIYCNGNYHNKKVQLVYTLLNYGAVIPEEYKQTLLDRLCTYFLYPSSLYARAIPYCLKVADILYNKGARVEEVDIYIGSFQSTLRVDIVKWLICRGKKVDVNTLFDVSRSGNKDVMQLLYDKGIRLNEDQKLQAFDQIFSRGSVVIEAAELLLSWGLDIKKSKALLSHWLYQYDESWSWLISKGIDIHNLDQCGKNALYYASSFNSYRNLKAIEYFLSHGLQFREEDKIEVLHGCLRDKELIQKFISLEFDISKSEWLHYSQTFEIVELLVNAGADINHIFSNSPSYSVLYSQICSTNDVRIIKYLIEKGARFRDEEELIDCISQCSLSKDIVEHLMLPPYSLKLEDIPILNNYYYQCNTEMVKWLISKGANVNKIDKNGRNALFSGYHYSLDKDVINLLVEQGIDIYLKDHQDHNALYHYVISNGRTNAKDVEIVKVFLALGLIFEQSDLGHLLQSRLLKGYDYGEEMCNILLNAGAKIEEINIQTVVSQGDIQPVEWLIEHGLDITMFDQQNNSLLYHALHNNRYTLIPILLSQGAKLIADEVNNYNIHGWHPLLYVINNYKCTNIAQKILDTHQNIDLSNAIFVMGGLISAKWLESKGVDFFARRSSDNKNALYTNCSNYNNVEVVKFLLEKGLKFDEEDKLPLFRSVVGWSKSKELISIFLAHGVDINAEAFLCQLVQRYSSESIDFLIEQGADPCKKDANGKTILYYLCGGNGYYNCYSITKLELLVNKGLTLDEEDKIPLLEKVVTANNINMVNFINRFHPNIKDSSLLFSAKTIDMAKWCIERGANINAKNKDGKDVLYQAVINNAPELAKFYILNHGMSFNEEDRLILLEHAVSVSNMTLIDVINTPAMSNIKESQAFHKVSTIQIAAHLLKLGADPSTPNADGKNALYSIAYTGYSNVITFLLNKGYKFDEEDKVPLLEHAVSQAQRGIINIMLQQGADVKCSDALHQAKYLDIVNILITAGADVSKVDEKGNTALHMAMQYSLDIQIIQKLLEHMTVSMTMLKNNEGKTAMNILNEKVNDPNKEKKVAMIMDKINAMQFGFDLEDNPLLESITGMHTELTEQNIDHNDVALSGE